MVELMLKQKYLVIIWMICGTITLAFILGNYHYYLSFSYSDFIVKWSMKIYNPVNQEEVADLKTIINFIVSFMVVSSLALIFLQPRYFSSPFQPME